jgi:hypothetical protein
LHDFRTANSFYYHYLSVLAAAQNYAAKHKLLRESDALRFLIISGNNILESGMNLTIGIVTLVIAMIPVVYLTYGLYASIAGFGALSIMAINYVVRYLGAYISRHVFYYYMSKGRLAKKMKQSIVELFADQETTDPYDPTVAWHAFRKYVKIGETLAKRDLDSSNAVDYEEFQQASKKESSADCISPNRENEMSHVDDL